MILQVDFGFKVIELNALKTVTYLNIIIVYHLTNSVFLTAKFIAPVATIIPPITGVPSIDAETIVALELVVVAS